VGKIQIKEGNHGNLPQVTSNYKGTPRQMQVLGERRTQWEEAAMGADPPNDESPSM